MGHTQGGTSCRGKGSQVVVHSAPGSYLPVPASRAWSPDSEGAAVWPPSEAGALRVQAQTPQAPGRGQPHEAGPTLVPPAGSEGAPWRSLGFFRVILLNAFLINSFIEVQFTYSKIHPILST